MFTGLVEALGRVGALDSRGQDYSLQVASGGLDLEDVRLGDSIAVNGVCLSVTALASQGFSADVSRETLRYSGLGRLQPGDPLNLEKALAAQGRFGGHLVSGHVDGEGEITAYRREGRALRLEVRAPAALARYIAPRGSICVDGVSLTVNEVEGANFELNLIPHTLEQTLIKYYSVGRRVNLEVDLIARYLERLLQAPGQGTGSPAADSASGLTRELLQRRGFAG